MPRRVTLPHDLASRPFLVDEARTRGISAGRLRGRDLATPFAGVRAPRDPDSDPLLWLCAALLPLLDSGQHFSHTTAARLWGAPMPHPFAAETPLHVSSLPPQSAMRRPGVIGHQAGSRDAPTTTRHGMPVSDAASTWVALGALLPLDELVVVGDYLVEDPVVLNPYDPRPYAALHDLARASSGFHGRGATRLRAALTLVRQGSESRPETLLRLLLARAGLPEPALNVDVTARDGRVLGRGDLVYPQWRTVVEYDGDQHRTTTQQYDRDISRVDSFIEAKWRVVRVRSRGLFVDPASTVVRVRRALVDGGWAPTRAS